MCCYQQPGRSLDAAYLAGDQWRMGGETEDGPFITTLNTEPSRVTVTQGKALAAKNSGKFEQINFKLHLGVQSYHG